MNMLQRINSDNVRKNIIYVYMVILTVIVCYFSSKIYKTDDLIWPRERYIIVATMVLCFLVVLFKLYFTKSMPLNKGIYLYHFVLIAPMVIMAFPTDYYELRPLYLIPMVVVLAADLSLGIIVGIAVVISTYVMIFTNLAEFMYVAMIIMVLGCISASQINNIKRFLLTSAVFWAVTFYLCGLYRYFALDKSYDTFQAAFAFLGLIMAVAVSIVIFLIKYWIFFIRIKSFAGEKSIPLVEMKEKSISLYYHSIEVGNLAKSAAVAIGADINLAYAGGLLHDVGKLGEGDDLKSALKTANTYGIPRNIKAIMIECSGKYRKPISKESAIVMLADSTVTSVEYVKNTKSNLSEDKIIENVFATRLNNGSLTHSNLSVEELYRIKQIFMRKYNF